MKEILHLSLWRCGQNINLKWTVGQSQPEDTLVFAAILQKYFVKVLLEGL